MSKGKIKLKVKSSSVGGEVRILTKRQQYSRIDGDVLIARIAQSCNINENNVRQALGSIIDAMRYFVLNGHTVSLGRFGSIGLSAKTQMVPKASQVSSDLVKGLKLVYKPSVEIKNECLGAISFETESDL